MASRARLATAVLLCIVVCTRPAAALDPSRALTQYLRHVWRLADGLPSQVVYSIAQTPDGYLWLGTSGGVARFDGVHFTVFDTSSTPGLPSNMVWSVQPARDGGVWIGTSEGLVHFAHGRMTPFAGNARLPSRFVQAVLEDRRGRVWVGTPKGVAVIDGDAIRARLPVVPRDATSTSSIAEDADGVIWITTNAGVAAIDGNTLRVRDTAVGQGARVAWIDRAGQACVIVAEPILCMDHGRWRARSGSGADVPPGVTAATEDRDGNVWIGARSGIIRLDAAGRQTTFPADEPVLSAAGYLAIFEDREGNLWVGTAGSGLARVSDASLAVFGLPEGVSSDRIVDVTSDAEGVVWVTTAGGVDRYANGAWTHDAAVPSRSAEALFADASGRVWLRPRDSDDLERIAPLPIASADIAPVGGVFMLSGARDGGLWISGSKGLFHFVNGALQTPPVTAVTTTVAREGRDGVWIGTATDGLMHWRDGVLTAWSKSNGLPTDSIDDVLEDADGTVWMGTDDKGLVRFKDGRFSSYGARAGLADFVCGIVDDQHGSLWLNTRRGIFRVDKRAIADVDAGTRQTLEAAAFDAASGLRSAQCQVGGHAVAAGRVWFPTANGLVAIDPAHLRTNAMPPLVHVEDALADGRPLDLTRPLDLPPGVQTLEIHYTATSLTAPDRVRFAFHMDDYDRGWTNAGGRRVAYYTKPPHGRYVFEVRAANEDGVWSLTPATLAFSVAPHVYETWWAYGLFALGLAGAFAGGVRLRVGVLKRRAAALEARGRELERLVDERTDALRGTVEELRRVQDQLARLSQATPDKIENVALWSASMAREIAGMIGAREIGVWRVDEGGLVRVSGSTSRPDVVDVLGGGGAVVPIPGMNGEVRGALVVDGASDLTPVTAQLLKGFAHQVGGALDLFQLRERLTKTESRQAALRAQMRDAGVEAVKVCPACRRCFGDSVARCPDDDTVLDGTRLFPLVIQERYRLVSLIGEGGAGHVFAATDERLRRDVALKVIRAEHLADARLRFRIEREARTLAQIDHPGVVALFDSGELDNGSVFFVMERLRGRDLASAIAGRGPGTPSQVANMLRDAAGALSAAHARGVIHRDIKPANIFLSPRDGGFATKVLDFGLATAGDIDVRVTVSGIMVGTPAYMSPEQVQGLSLDPRSDLYSLAAVGYEALTARRVVSSQDVGNMLVDVLYKTPEPLSSASPQLAVVDDLFARAFAKDPAQRPGDIQAWADAIASRLAVLPASGRGW